MLFLASLDLSVSRLAKRADDPGPPQAEHDALINTSPSPNIEEPSYIERLEETAERLAHDHPPPTSTTNGFPDDAQAAEAAAAEPASTLMDSIMLWVLLVALLATAKIIYILGMRAKKKRQAAARAAAENDPEAAQRSRAGAGADTNMADARRDSFDEPLPAYQVTAPEPSRTTVSRLTLNRGDSEPKDILSPTSPSTLVADDRRSSTSRSPAFPTQAEMLEIVPAGHSRASSSRSVLSARSEGPEALSPVPLINAQVDVRDPPPAYQP